MGRRQIAKIYEPISTLWLRWLLVEVPGELKLLRGSYATFLSLFREACLEFGLESLGLGPGSVRPGCATHLFVSGVETSRLRASGRWKCSASALAGPKLDHRVIQHMSGAAVAMSEVLPVGAQALAKVSKVLEEQLDLGLDLGPTDCCDGQTCLAPVAAPPTLPSNSLLFGGLSILNGVVQDHQVG